MGENLYTDRQRHSNLPIPDWLFGYQKDWLRHDVIAGLATAAVVIPKAMAYATIAGLPVEVGLYTALVPMAIYALIGTSRPLSVSTTTTLAILAAAELSEVMPNADPPALIRASVTLTLMVGGYPRSGFVAAAGLHRQFHFRTGTDRLQSGHRPCHRAGSTPETAWHPYPQRHLLPQHHGDHSRYS